MSKKIVKTITCIVLFTVLMGTAVFAATADREARVRGVIYNDNFEGSGGSYSAWSDSHFSYTYARNSTTTEYYYSGYVKRFNYIIQDYDIEDRFETSLVTGGIRQRNISRDIDSYVYNYVHNVTTTLILSNVTSISIDTYDYLAKQYYED